MKQHRIDSPETIDPVSIAKHIDDGFRVIVQYSKSGYSAQQLAQLNNLAKVHGRNFEIRFYGHYSEVFDASVLRLIPDAQCVSIDCLRNACNLEALSDVQNLTELSLGVFELNDPEVLDYCNPTSLKSLTLGDTRKCNIDIGNLSKSVGLEKFHTAGHTKNISTICSLPSLKNLSLASIRKKDDIGFISSIPALKALRLILGGRPSIAEIASAQLQSLEIIRVHGLEDVGDFGRFEKLESLWIEDQIRLAEIKVGPNPSLRSIEIINCKTLGRIAGIASLNALSELRICKTAIDYEEFMSKEMPNGIKSLAFYTGKIKRDSDILKDLQNRGVHEFLRQ